MRSVLALCAAVLVASCGGGGGASANPGGPAGVALSVLPATGTFYAGIPYTMTIVGGRKPFILSSSEPSLMPVPQNLNDSTFQVLPANPAVIDANLPEGSLPIRTVIITVRDSLGFTTSADIKVGRNFLTGYGVSFASTCPGSSGTSPIACAGGETVVRLSASINGNLHGGRRYRFETLRGPFSWVFPGSTVSGNTVTVTTDHEGAATAIMRVNANVPTQLAVLRVTDVETGVFVDHVFTINSGALASVTLEIIPDTLTFTGATRIDCGTGSADVQVFDGTPPYTAVSSSPFVVVEPTRSTTNPGRFTVTATNSSVCLNNATVTISDANNARGVVEITTEQGSGDPPGQPLIVVPNALVLDCGQAASVSVIGGSGTFSVSTVNPNLAAAVSGNTITVTRAGNLGDVAGPLNDSTVIVTDGASVSPLTVTSPSSCTTPVPPPPVR